MEIYECKRMEEIVTNEEGGEAGDEICFNQLKYLWLDGLPTLRSFHLGNHTIKFPSLVDVYVDRCPELKIFSNGVLSMPKLKDVTLRENYNTKRWPVSRQQLQEQDFNTIIKRFWEENFDTCVGQLFTEKVCSHAIVFFYFWVNILYLPLLIYLSVVLCPCILPKKLLIQTHFYGSMNIYKLFVIEIFIDIKMRELLGSESQDVVCQVNSTSNSSFINYLLTAL
jgi:hypothetical protein